MSEETEDTINNDVSNVEEQVINNKRLDAVEALVLSRNEELENEVAESTQRLSEETDEVEKVEDVQNVEDPEPVDKMVVVKVDGKETELPLSEVIKGYQKDSTASQRLNQLAIERRELEQNKLDFEKEKEKLQKKEEPEKERDVEDSSNEVDEITAALDDLSVGDTEERAAAALKLKELLGGRRDNPAIHEDEIISQASKQAAKQVQMDIDYNSAQKQFDKDYKDIVNDDTLHRMAYDVFERVVPQSATFDEAFKKAGDEIRQWREKLVNGDEGENSSTVSDKIALKERLPKEPVSTGKTARPKPQSKPETTQDIIAAMKAERGQAF